MPERVIPKKEVEGTTNYCPAFNDFYKNTFAVKMPFDVNIAKINEKVRLGVNPKLQIQPGAMEALLVVEDAEHEGMKDQVMVQIMLNNTFVSDTPHTTIETLPPILHGVREEIKYINGRFDCHAWQRPLQLGFHIPKETLDAMNHDDSILFKKGEVVQYVRFNTPNGEPVKMYNLDKDDVALVSEYVARNTSIAQHLKNFNFKEVIDRVRQRRPKKFVRNKNYDPKGE